MYLLWDKYGLLSCTNPTCYSTNHGCYYANMVCLAIHGLIQKKRARGDGGGTGRSGGGGRWFTNMILCYIFKFQSSSSDRYVSLLKLRISANLGFVIVPSPTRTWSLGPFLRSFWRDKGLKETVTVTCFVTKKV